ncbi:MAG: DUF84 family protein [Proteobacteria bacterium]|nr:DUF84 family protein [Pseudomonadota bacterium]
MDVVVASRNPVKQSAVRQAFSSQFPSVDLELIPVDVESGVNAQPDGDEETRRGARSRVDAARRARPDADFWVGLEGGVATVDNQLMGCTRENLSMARR